MSAFWKYKALWHSFWNICSYPSIFRWGNKNIYDWGMKHLQFSNLKYCMKCLGTTALYSLFNVAALS